MWKQTKPNTSSRPDGQTASPEGLGERQKAERGNDTAPLTFEQEKQQLKQNGLWLTQNDLAYISVSFYLNEPNNFDSIKCQYSFRTHGRTDLLSNKFSAKFTRNRFDYIRNVKERWSDVTTQAPIYLGVHDCIKQGLKTNQYVGGAKAVPVKKWNGKGTMPLIPGATSLLYQDLDGDWHISIHHHDIHVELSYPQQLWEQDLQRWIDQYAIQIEAPREKRNRNIPPFVKLVWGAV